MIPGLGGGMDPRQMSMMMKKFGIDVRDIDGVQQVVVRTAVTDYIFDKATVSVMKAQGVETWQVSGKPRTVPRDAAAGPSSASPSASTSASTSASSSAKPSAASATPPAPAAPVPIPDEDIALVMKETGKGRVEALAALKASNGDLAEAILKLSP